MIKDQIENCIITPTPYVPSTTVTITSGGSQCHGCTGKGWVETSDRQPHRCPVCNGSGTFTAPGLPYVPSPFPYIPNPFPIVPYLPPWQPNGPWYGRPYVGDIPPGLEPYKVLCIANGVSPDNSKLFLNGNEVNMEDIAHTYKC